MQIHPFPVLVFFVKKVGHVASSQRSELSDAQNQVIERQI
jgi:hypothetical protein